MTETTKPTKLVKPKTTKAPLVALSLAEDLVQGLPTVESSNKSLFHVIAVNPDGLQLSVRVWIEGPDDYKAYRPAHTRAYCRIRVGDSPTKVDASVFDALNVLWHGSSTGKDTSQYRSITATVDAFHVSPVDHLAVMKTFQESGFWDTLYSEVVKLFPTFSFKIDLQEWVCLMEHLLSKTLPTYSGTHNKARIQAHFGAGNDPMFSFNSESDTKVTYPKPKTPKSDAESVGL